jgi:hypothetical protein
MFRRMRAGHFGHNVFESKRGARQRNAATICYCSGEALSSIGAKQSLLSPNLPTLPILVIELMQKNDHNGLEN